MILGLIPARGGSKGIPRKNIKPLGGKPLIQWTIEAARASKCLDRLVVSTEDAEIKAVVQGLGVEVLDRPAALARDDTPMIDVVEHALDAIDADVLVLLQPTNPFRTSEIIRKALELLRTPDVSSVAAVTLIPARYSPQRALQIIDASGQEQLYPVLSGGIPRRRQDVWRTYIPAGTVYAYVVEAVLDQASLWPSLCAPLIVEGDEAINLDEPEDWAEAERRLASMLVSV